jgi:tetratricopeptide (TPR) repeat protein
MSCIATLRAVLLLSPLLLFRVSARAEMNLSAPSQNPALAALNQGRVDDATRILRSQISTDPHNALAHQLLCRAFYSIEREDAAIPECEAAVANASSVSDNYLWLGRAYGLKASRANPVSAFRLARKVVAAFERAVQLDPASTPALSDLGEFYVSAPSLVGGGIDKAQQLSNRIMPVSATKAHRLLALIAEKKGDTSAAESEFKKAVQAQPSPESWVDLAAFYQRQKKNDQCVAAIQSAIRLDHAKDAALVDAASILTDANSSPQLAQQLLVAYLASPAKSDGAPAAKVHVQLGDLLLKSGDPTAAGREYQSALALASAYIPARKALHALQPSQAR